jgi:hypothetical protein
MKIALIAGLILAALTNQSYAQDLTSGSTSGSSSGATATSSPHQAQQAQAQAVYAPTINEPAQPANTSETVHYSGADRSAPTVIGGSFAAGFAPDNCSNTAQAGISGPGFGASLGRGIPDKNCEILRRVDAHNRTAAGYFAMGQRSQAMYQLNQSAIDLCIADGYSLSDCRSAIH